MSAKSSSPLKLTRAATASTEMAMRRCVWSRRAIHGECFRASEGSAAKNNLLAAKTRPASISSGGSSNFGSRSDDLLPNPFCYLLVFGHLVPRAGRRAIPAESRVLRTVA